MKEFHFDTTNGDVFMEVGRAALRPFDVSTLDVVQDAAPIPRKRVGPEVVAMNELLWTPDFPYGVADYKKTGRYTMGRTPLCNPWYVDAPTR